MTDSIISNDMLKKITGYVQEAAMERSLKEQGIACFNSPNGIWTTTGLIKEAGLIRMGYKSPTREKQQFI